MSVVRGYRGFAVEIDFECRHIRLLRSDCDSPLPLRAGSVLADDSPEAVDWKEKVGEWAGRFLGLEGTFILFLPAPNASSFSGRRWHFSLQAE